ncbi:hemerythrin domain-containing protein [Streptomyces sp. MS2A]|nr:hemerythrin domain-containing protein [Streptomyces sp. MS2A]
MTASPPSAAADRERLSAWASELRAVHERLRAALRAARESSSFATADPDAPARELLLYCHGFCAALDGHHRAEDRRLFPAVEDAHPELAPILRTLEQDHSMIAHLLAGLRNAVDRAAGPVELERHLEGIAAIMESHFRYEEKMLLTVLETLQLDAPADEVLGGF